MAALIKKITHKWSASGIIRKDDVDIYEYGLELFLFTVSNLAVIVISSAFIGKAAESFILLLTILPLQSLGGGYHAKTHLRCFLIMYIGWWIIIFILPFVRPLAATFIFGVSLLVIYRLAPVPHENVTMSDARRAKLKKVVRVTASLLSILSGVLFWAASEHIGKTMAVGIGVAAVSMLAAHVKNRSLNRQA